MSIPIERLHETDFSDVATGEAIPPSTPGDILRREFLEPMGLSANALARALHVPANRITAILNGQRSITADTALRLARFFGTSPEFWINLQSAHDLRLAQRNLDRINREIEPLQVA